MSRRVKAHPDAREVAFEGGVTKSSRSIRPIEGDQHEGPTDLPKARHHRPLDGVRGRGRHRNGGTGWRLLYEDPTHARRELLRMLGERSLHDKGHPGEGPSRAGGRY